MQLTDLENIAVDLELQMALLHEEGLQQVQNKQAEGL